MILDALPLTPNGKINRQALPDPDKSRPDLETPFIAPRTSMEQQLSQIWAGVLSLEQVGVHDSFIELGGHSLSAAQVISQGDQDVSSRTALTSLFEAPTVEQMAAIIAQNHAEKIGQDELARILTELDSLSDEEARRLIEKETAQKSGLLH